MPKNGEYWADDFDTLGNMRTSRDRVGQGPQISSQGKMYYPVYARAYVMSQYGVKAGRKATDEDSSQLSYGAFTVPDDVPPPIMVYTLPEGTVSEGTVSEDEVARVPAWRRTQFLICGTSEDIFIDPVAPSQAKGSTAKPITSSAQTKSATHSSQTKGPAPKLTTPKTDGQDTTPASSRVKTPASESRTSAPVKRNEERSSQAPPPAFTAKVLRITGRGLDTQNQQARQILGKAPSTTQIDVESEPARPTTEETAVDLTSTVGDTVLEDPDN
ncbi:hypothetical protein LTR84_013101 [Exophiala bonariae]|uniref:Uncharacterized protein n=1 Tax=Exophiala bonariae TaxID=1690606 RepID=A0AAV9NHD3_9EURO|nr:hypothetical protein LTR84_013101 [Exophiala bonariae]